MFPSQVEKLILQIGDQIKPKAYTFHTLNPNQRLLAALRFYATGSVYHCVGDAEHISKALVFVCVYKVTNALNRMRNINWPTVPNQLRNIPIEFFKLSKRSTGTLPGICAI